MCYTCTQTAKSSAVPTAAADLFFFRIGISSLIQPVVASQSRLISAKLKSWKVSFDGTMSTELNGYRLTGVQLMTVRSADYPAYVVLQPWHLLWRRWDEWQTRPSGLPPAISLSISHVRPVWVGCQLGTYLSTYAAELNLFGRCHGALPTTTIAHTSAHFQHLLWRLNGWLIDRFLLTTSLTQIRGERVDCAVRHS